MSGHFLHTHALIQSLTLVTMGEWEIGGFNHLFPDRPIFSAIVVFRSYPRRPTSCFKQSMYIVLAPPRAGWSTLS